MHILNCNIRIPPGVQASGISTDKFKYYFGGPLYIIIKGSSDEKLPSYGEPLRSHTTPKEGDSGLGPRVSSIFVVGSMGKEGKH